MALLVVAVLLLLSISMLTDRRIVQKWRKNKDQNCNQNKVNKRTNRRTIFSIKIQKTGSSTLRASLWFYAQAHNLSICVDMRDMYSLNWPYEIDVRRVIKLPEEKCELIAEEMIYNKDKGT